MKYVGGIDSGSTTTKLVILQNNNIQGYYVVPTGANNRKAYQKVMELGMVDQALQKADLKFLVATGYGRQNIDDASKQISEITCQAKAINWLFPESELIIDIGGQDFKVIELNKSGRVLNFAMNEKCAAGTGRYLELMAGIFNMSLDEFGHAAALTRNQVEITSICTVFAETEVISHISKGTEETEIVAGVFHAVAKRVYSLTKQFLKGKKEIVFTGGVARNAGMVKALESVTGCSIRVPEEPQITGALGAALFAYEKIA